MNFYVVSPNVYNDGNVEFYLNEMRERQIVIMGYSKEDGNKWVNMFCNTMKVGDCVIVARGANWQKQSFFAGIITSDTMPYTEEGESLYREVNFLTNLENEDIPFNTDCAFGTSKQSGSIYQLKPGRNPADKAVAEKVSSLIAQRVSNQTFRKNTYSLKEISTWPNACVSLPGIQRGLVWKPAQVELLWDSILRGFPIGTFTLSESDTASHDSRYYLMDGQQRFNSIALAFEAIKDDAPILWIDISPSIPISSTRKFLVRLTTMAHPWGYQNDDNCSPLSTQDKRTLLDKIGRRSVYKETLKPNESYPFKSNKPIPMAWMLNAPTIDAKSFVSYLKQRMEATSLPLPFDGFSEEDVKNLENFYFEVFKAVKSYRVGTSIISAESIDKTTSGESGGEQPEALETLFRRIGTGGTPITQEELNYSAIKAYWPKELREENDRIAQKYMNPERLVRIAFRLALTDTTNGNTVFPGDLSIQRIRKIAQNPDCEEYRKISNWYLTDGEVSKIGKVMDMVNLWLTIGNCPKMLRTSIARNSPDIYLLLMFLASELIDVALNESQMRLLQGVAFYLHWFADKNKSNCANIILQEYSKCNPKNHDALFQAITFGIQECIRQNNLPLICNPADITLQSNSWGGLDYPVEQCGHTWNLIAHNREMLLYAQLEYLTEKFPNYDPAQRGMWEQHNRPWDLDHIVPQDWINGKRGDYREYCKKWLWTNGNFAAISFEANRSKSNQADWDEYDQNANNLLFDERIKGVTANVTYCDKEARDFGEITFLRTKAIYESCYEMLSLALGNGSLSEVVAKRKELLTSVQRRLKENGVDAKVRWTDDKNSLKEFEIEIDQENDDFNWCHAWLSVGYTPDKSHYVCICTQDGENIELGVRKHPDDRQISGSEICKEGYPEYNEWWYAEKDIRSDVWSVEEICLELLSFKPLFAE